MIILKRIGESSDDSIDDDEKKKKQKQKKKKKEDDLNDEFDEDEHVGSIDDTSNGVSNSIDSIGDANSGLDSISIGNTNSGVLVELILVMLVVDVGSIGVHR
ncbi:hypothetical protein M0804_012197 [Polistes exclamans]|nr:hypothetical protein M0804_012197 [Polistes exclamans]